MPSFDVTFNRIFLLFLVLGIIITSNDDPKSSTVIRINHQAVSHYINI